jgi:hypothetical protein
MHVHQEEIFCMKGKFTLATLAIACLTAGAWAQSNP